MQQLFFATLCIVCYAGFSRRLHAEGCGEPLTVLLYYGCIDWLDDTDNIKAGYPKLNISWAFDGVSGSVVCELNMPADFGLQNWCFVENEHAQIPACSQVTFYPVLERPDDLWLTRTFWQTQDVADNIALWSTEARDGPDNDLHVELPVMHYTFYQGCYKYLQDTAHHYEEDLARQHCRLPSLLCTPPDGEYASRTEGNGTVMDWKRNESPDLKSFWAPPPPPPPSPPPPERKCKEPCGVANVTLFICGLLGGLQVIVSIIVAMRCPKRPAMTDGPQNKTPLVRRMLVKTREFFLRPYGLAIECCKR